jgi:CubicO group peptidase (beta-lactamase class C family)
MRQVAHELGPHDVLYSDLNFMLLGWAIERCARTPLDRLFRRVIGRPLAMSSARFRPTPSQRRQTAATELDGDQRLGPGLIWGEVHDGNAFAMGGVSGHAGLFASAGDLTRFVAWMLGATSPSILATSTVRELAVPPRDGPRT